MHFLNAMAIAASCLGLASGRLVGVGIPATVKPGDSFNTILLSEDYIQSVTDIALAVGYASGAGYPGSLGIYVQSYYLGPDKSNQLGNFNETTMLPATAAPGEATFTASLTSLYGAGYSPTLSEYNVTFTIGTETSTTYVYSG